MNTWQRRSSIADNTGENADRVKWGKHVSEITYISSNGAVRSNASAMGSANWRKLSVELVDEERLAKKSRLTPIAAFLKRSFDCLASLGLLVFLAPMLILTALAIRLDSRGPIFYRQRRVGLNGEVFEVIKFRSMFVDAEKNGAQYANKDDRRITRVGHIIRHFRIDEIPQVFNVLRGEMSFVGPRPERPEFTVTLEKEIDHYQARHLVKPGITGWAQVCYEYASTIEGTREKLQYDLYYVNNYSLWLDAKIVLMTVRVALFGLGAR